MGEERAIVTDIAGTTRDIIEENIRLNGINLRLIDTAGIRSTDDIIEKMDLDDSRKGVLIEIFQNIMEQAIAMVMEMPQHL